MRQVCGLPMRGTVADFLGHLPNCIAVLPVRARRAAECRRARAPSTTTTVARYRPTACLAQRNAVAECKSLVTIPHSCLPVKLACKRRVWQPGTERSTRGSCRLFGCRSPLRRVLDKNAGKSLTQKILRIEQDDKSIETYNPCRCQGPPSPTRTPRATVVLSACWLMDPTWTPHAHQIRPYSCRAVQRRVRMPRFWELLHEVLPVQPRQLHQRIQGLSVLRAL